ncbi:hypothetical protein R3P38DRAFT_2796021 [Favolaschia claudopus]|uniref:Uncharacterized protein n=1 Tax=Favolaschia claudopus TaxID=2862362 RepID=A0AAW0A609_9AGAR
MVKSTARSRLTNTKLGIPKQAKQPQEEQRAPANDNGIKWRGYGYRPRIHRGEGYTSGLYGFDFRQSTPRPAKRRHNNATQSSRRELHLDCCGVNPSRRGGGSIERSKAGTAAVARIGIDTALKTKRTRRRQRDGKIDGWYAWPKRTLNSDLEVWRIIRKSASRSVESEGVRWLEAQARGEEEEEAVMGYSAAKRAYLHHGPPTGRNPPRREKGGGNAADVRTRGLVARWGTESGDEGGFEEMGKMYERRERIDDDGTGGDSDLRCKRPLRRSSSVLFPASASWWEYDGRRGSPNQAEGEGQDAVLQGGDKNDIGGEKERRAYVGPGRTARKPSDAYFLPRKRFPIVDDDSRLFPKCQGPLTRDQLRALTWKVLNGAHGRYNNATAILNSQQGSSRNFSKKARKPSEDFACHRSW